MSGVRLRVVDAFTEHPGSGNPAGVVLLDPGDWPPAAWMRSISAELGLSETAFAQPLDQAAEAEWALRWFTPVVEDDLCGHATLATAHVIATDTGWPRTLRFNTRSGLLPVSIGADRAITLNFPAASATEVPVPDGLTSALGTTAVRTCTTGALRDLLVVLPDEATVRALTPDLARIADLTRRDNIRGVTVTAAAASPDGGYDFVSRFFSPADGIAEDPVTGSAHTALAPYWAAELGRISLVGLQVSARSGLVHTHIDTDRVHLTGRAVTVMDGTWLHGPSPNSVDQP